MEYVLLEMRKREAEIDEFLRSIADLEQPPTKPSETFYSILKSQSLILLYNYAEGVFRLLFKELINEINQKEILYEEACVALQKIALNKDYSIDFFNKKKNILTIHSLIETRKKTPLQFGGEEEGEDEDKKGEKIDNYLKTFISGNIDARSVREALQDFGFARDLESRLKCAILKDIKVHRNNLAHGNFTFEEVGRDLTITKIEEWKIEVFRFFASVQIEIFDYLQNRSYLKPY